MTTRPRGVAARSGGAAARSGGAAARSGAAAARSGGAAAALHAEWVKLRSLRGTWWLAAGAIAVAVAGSAAMVASTHASPGAPGGGPDPTRLALTGLDLGQAVIAVLAVLAIAEEHSTGTIRVTLAAIPRRQLMLGAKAVTVGGLAVAAAVPAVAGCLVAGRLLAPGAGLGPDQGVALVWFAHGATLRAAVGAVMYLGLVALLGLSIGTIVRDTAVATGAVLALLYLPPLLALILSGPWHRHIEQLAPMTAGLSIEATRHLHRLPDAPWTGLGILAAWAAGALLGAGALLRVRDV
jgi:ABC-2 type transport system permease protein